MKSYRVTLRPADRVRYVTLRTIGEPCRPGADDGQGPLMRAALVALALLAATPATAGAQFGQVEPLTLRGDDDCVRTTGAPGELALPATDGVRFAQATRAGVQLGRTVTLGKGFDCSAAVTRASGAGVIAGELDDSVVASVRAPGGDWGAPVSVPVVKDSARG